MDGLLRFAPHTGYLPHDRTPLFVAMAGTDPVDQVHFAAREGLAGILDPWANDRSPEKIEAISMALDETGLVAGCMCLIPLARFTQPLWVAERAKEELQEHLRNSVRIATDLRSDVLAVLLFAEEDTASNVQRQRAIDRLREAADMAYAKGIRLAIEPIGGVPGQLLKSFAEAVDLVDKIAHPGVKLIFDTGHIAAFAEPILQSYIEAYDQIAVLQLADMPNRVEMGAGDIDFVPILSHAVSRGYRGLIELEYHWSNPDIESEMRGLEMLRTLENKVRENIGA